MAEATGQAMPAAPQQATFASFSPYALSLIAAVVLNLVLRLRILQHVVHTKTVMHGLLHGVQLTFLVLFGVLLIGFVWILLWRVMPLLLRRQLPRRRHLLLLAQLASGMAGANLISENLVMYRINLSSYTLMLDAALLYVGMTLLFLFWYWHVDNPARFKGPLWERPLEAGAAAVPYGIVFPEETLEWDVQRGVSWRPGFMDYAYFTILSSNCFGPPEGHLLVGPEIKTLHIVHSLSMITVFIVILARAINTLS